MKILLTAYQDGSSVNMKPIHIIIEANHFPERQENIRDRAKKFAEKLNELLKKERFGFAPNSIGSVLIRLIPSGYTEFTLPEREL